MRPGTPARRASSMAALRHLARSWPFSLRAALLTCISHPEELTTGTWRGADTSLFSHTSRPAIFTVFYNTLRDACQRLTWSSLILNGERGTRPENLPHLEPDASILFAWPCWSLTAARSRDLTGTVRADDDVGSAMVKCDHESARSQPTCAVVQQDTHALLGQSPALCQHRQRYAWIGRAGDDQPPAPCRCG